MEDGIFGPSSTAALAELDRVGQAVRLRSRWYGRFLLMLAAGTLAYYVVVNAAAPATPPTLVAVSLGWTVFVVSLARWARAQPVTWRGIRQLRLRVMSVYFGLVAATVVLGGTVWQDTPGRWALGVVPALPCLVGAWVVLRR